MIDIGKDLQQAFEDGYKKGFADGQSQPIIQPQGIDKDRLIDTAEAIIEVLEGVIEDAKQLQSQPTVEQVPLSEIYRVIAGHSNYHGDNILAALTCIAEGKEVKPVKPLSQPTSDGWIPVSSGEKPKNDEYYIITTNDGLVECAHRDNRRWYTEEATCGWYSDNEILAYMPLPPAYKESE